MNTTTLTAARPAPGRNSLYRPRSLDLQDRVARRLGMALLTWSRNREALRSPETVLLRREVERAATDARGELHRQLHTHGSSLL
ncbi:hypothetical protein BJ978_001015 [Agromyces terreus]|uniref:Uncharacterized protein n=1 Tax=Agromyces terreus TaxID=424795 RepID=A0A9X2H5E7_9MICO|nr:hypothetical protein [Agromyces terreus]MCP2370339.1 hypothetical protein [Agromyces terreus]